MSDSKKYTLESKMFLAEVDVIQGGVKLEIHYKDSDKSYKELLDINSTLSKTELSEILQILHQVPDLLPIPKEEKAMSKKEVIHKHAEKLAVKLANDISVSFNRLIDQDSEISNGDMVDFIIISVLTSYIQVSMNMARAYKTKDFTMEEIYQDLLSRFATKSLIASRLPVGKI